MSGIASAAPVIPGSVATFSSCSSEPSVAICPDHLMVREHPRGHAHVGAGAGGQLPLDLADLAKAVHRRVQALRHRAPPSHEATVGGLQREAVVGRAVTR
jgi:hypothetical protein